MKLNTLLALTLVAVVAGCAAKPPRVAQEKVVDVDGVTLKFNGSFDDEKNILILSVNNDPIMQGKFPPYTPTQNLKAKYKEIDVRSHCYFGSVLGNQGGAFGAIAGLVQSSTSSTADKCELYVNNELVEHLYF
ncbi:hypothetical protein TUM4438_37340 [Shewanella sairae]|uniref:Lipoprotein n=1 Tax=Shewanella sairae TaxID=190310 RepID=A0ABQ4PPF1_9GAMM|nr:hypothetical protein [Shewanella sairae]MCL1130380.1 hypothetical protein [Shewanella sairae]GIU50630.1 hypothetical protein TUM4438_37340 [Shewanella sairae]